MTSQELSENKDNNTLISQGHAIGLLLVFWMLNLVGQGIALLPEISEKILTHSQELLTEDPMVFSQRIMAEIGYPWYINVIQLVVFVFVLWLFKRQQVCFFSLKTLTKQDVVQMLTYSVIFMLLSLGSEHLVAFFQSDFSTANQRMLEGIVENSSKLTMFVSIVIVAPITEEVMYRGIFSVIFRKRRLLGYLICALAFTFSHSPGDVSSFCVYLVMALGLGGIYWKTGRLEASIFAHMLNNFIGFLLMVV